MRVRNFVTHLKAGLGLQVECVQEQGVQEDTGPRSEEVTRGWRKLHYQ